MLVVVDKLLAGFDAPPCTYLYIDKSMQHPGFFQAICRVNRLDSDDKESEYALEEIRNASGETLDMNTYEADMRLLIDTHIQAEEPRTNSPFADISLLDLLVNSGIADAINSLSDGIKSNKEAVAETIENKVIVLSTGSFFSPPFAHIFYVPSSCCLLSKNHLHANYQRGLDWIYRARVQCLVILRLPAPLNHHPGHLPAHQILLTFWWFSAGAVPCPSLYRWENKHPNLYR